MTVNLYQLPYTEFLQLGRAWSPNWTDRQRGFGWTVVLAPPGLTEILSETGYYFLLARRIEWHIADWIENYGSEMAVDDSDDSHQVYIATVQMIAQTMPANLAVAINAQQTPTEIANIMSSYLHQAFHDRVFPHGEVAFPVPLLEREKSADFADCIRQEVTLQGWLTEAFD